MFCSPIHLFVDLTLWYSPFFFEALSQSFENYTNGDIDTYDCALTSAPCGSNITKALVFSAPEFVFWFDLFVVYFGVTLVSFIGIVGNILNIIVMSTSNIANDSTNNLFLWLSVSDLINSLQCELIAVVCLLCFIDNGMALNAFNLTSPYLLANMNKMSLLSLDLVTVISIQRAAAVIIPFKVFRIFTNKNTNIIIAILISISVITTVPTFLGVAPRWIFHPYHNRVISLGYNFLFLDYVVIMDYTTTYFYVRSIFDLPLIVVAIYLTIAKLNRQDKSRSKMTTTTTSLSSKSKSSATAPSTTTSSNSVRKVKIIKMSVTVCVVTFIIFSFNIVGYTILQQYSQSIFKSPAVLATNYGSVLLNAIGASFNFFLYVVMSTQFRESLFLLLRLKPSSDA